MLPSWNKDFTYLKYHYYKISQHLGRQHQKQILFCDCEEDAVTLVKLKLWPGSTTRPTVAFHFKLMELAETLLLECHVSLRKFCDALGILTKSSTLPMWVCCAFHFNIHFNWYCPYHVCKHATVNYWLLNVAYWVSIFLTADKEYLHNTEQRLIWWIPVICSIPITSALCY